MVRDLTGLQIAVQQEAWEEVIRPFKENVPQWKIGRPEQPQNTDEPILTWSATVDVQIWRPPVLGFQTKEEESEVERTVTEKRIENELDPSQYVDIEVIDEITFRRPDGTTITRILDNEDE